MQSDANTDKFFQSKVLGHPAGLFVLFFTEMWERFSFYGMRVLLIQFLITSVIGTNPGWEWDVATASSLYATYAGLLYLTPIMGGLLADKFLGYRRAVALGALIMTLGHACMALDTEITLYFGLIFLVIGTGFFKPTITSIISEMYKGLPQKKDGAYTIFYMGVNAGAFFGMMLCGYVAERVGWSWGFGLAGVFMLLGLLQFWLAKSLFGTIGDKPAHRIGSVVDRPEIKGTADILDTNSYNPPVDSVKDPAKRNPFTLVDIILCIITAAIGLIFLMEGPLAINGYGIIPGWLELQIGQTVLPPKVTFIIIGLLLFLFLLIFRILRYDRTTAFRMVAVIIFALFTIFFWMSFEQGATSLVVFAKDNTDRFLDGGAATSFLIVDLVLTFGPLLIITWVLLRLWIETRREILWSNLTLIFCFLLIWGLGIWKTNMDMSTKPFQITYKGYKSPDPAEVNKDGSPVFYPVTEGMNTDGLLMTTRTDTMPATETFAPGQLIKVSLENDVFRLVDEDEEKRIQKQLADNPGKASCIVEAQVVKEVDMKVVEITASWFSILNSFFIIAFASLFSRIWESKYNPSAAVKYGLGLIIMAAGFGILAYGSTGIVSGGSDAARVSLWWLVFAYLFHTIGELCVSPVGLSYVSKLVPGRMIAFMFGMWYLAIAIGNYSAASLGGMIEEIQKEYSMSTFFLIFTIVPAAAGIVVICLGPLIKRLMQGVK
jgi:proton-dependent oligopeptide transporter, POT family